MTNWREIQRNNFTKIEKLLDFLELDHQNRERILKLPRFPLNLPVRLADKIDKNSLTDPIFLQFVPLDLELKGDFGKKDPTEDRLFQLTPRFLQKYSSRALIISTGACAMHCRFCFRQNYDYETSSSNFEEEISLIQKDTSLIEIILSGGDPLSLSDDKLIRLIEKLSEIEHIQIIRFHSRFLIGIPERLNESFLTTLKNCPKKVVFIFHINHAKEIDEDVALASQKLQKTGALVLNQSTLLKGVNDNYESLKDLSLKLVISGITPYYLHALDPVEGASHFEIDDCKALDLIKELQESLPGYSVPRLVREIPHKKSKTILKMI
jgi:lysine 2,3-aminomutase